MKKIILCFCFIFLVFSVSFAQNNSSQLKNNKKKLEQEILNTQKLLNETKKNKNTTLQQASLLRKQINAREGLICALNNEIFDLEMELELNIKLSRDLDKKLEYMKTDYERVVYLAYKNRKMVDKITFLLSSEDFAQMFRRLKYYSVFADNVMRQVELIKKTQEEIKLKTQEIDTIRENKLLLLEGKENEIRKLEIDRKTKTRTAQNLKKQENKLAAELKNKEKERRELDYAIKKAIEREILASNKKNKKPGKATDKSNQGAREILMTPEEKLVNNSFVSNKGRLPWPVEKGTKVLDFGRAPHPDVPSVIIDNKGIDILVEANAPVRAVFEGIVTGVMDFMGSKVLMIRHGEYITVYQNLATVSVKKGDKVKTKQVVGTVAHLAGSSSYELHFEVWKNDVNLNPNGWIAKK